MSEKPASSLWSAANLYLFAGIVFLGAGVTFLLTNSNTLWVTFFALGMVFFVLSSTERTKAAKAAEPPQTPPDDAPPS